MLTRLERYEKEKMSEFHQVILDDQGAADLVPKMRKLRFEIEILYDKNYKAPM
jgi:hypothetical protein